MRLISALVIIGALCVSVPAFAVDAGKADAKVTATSKPTTPTMTEPPLPPQAPKTPGEAIDQGKQLLELAKTKQWFAFSAGAIWLLMFAFKLGRKNLAFMQQIPKRALWIAVPLLSVAAMLLARLQGDLSWAAAAAVLFSGPSVAFANDLIKRGILGKEPTEPVSGKG